MSWYGGYGDWAPYVPVAQKLARGRAAAKQLAKKEKREPAPVVLEGRKIAKTFWGLQWCENLERHSSIANRLPRGATYVRNGSVADLVIEPGSVRAVVAGSEAYFVKLSIKTLGSRAWESICSDCAQSVDSLLDLLQGRFSDGVMQRLTHPDNGLLPHKNEISMSCTCPDSAGVCKHIAAVFYGVAARLDRQPELLFKLRKVDHLELVAQATTASNIDQAFGGATDSLGSAELGDIFGIELDTTANPAARPGRRASKPAGRPKTTKAAKATSKQGKAQTTAASANLPASKTSKAMGKQSVASRRKAEAKPVVNVKQVEPIVEKRAKAAAQAELKATARQSAKAKPTGKAKPAAKKSTAAKGKSVSKSTKPTGRSSTKPVAKASSTARRTKQG